MTSWRVSQPLPGVEDLAHGLCHPPPPSVSPLRGSPGLPIPERALTGLTDTIFFNMRISWVDREKTSEVCRSSSQPPLLPRFLGLCSRGGG